MIAAEGIPEGLPPGRARKGRSERQGADGRQGSAAFSEVSGSDKGAVRVVRGLETVKCFDSEISLADKLSKKTRA